MADTIITNSPDRTGNDGDAGWVVALLLIVTIAIGGLILYRNGAFDPRPVAEPNESLDINITLPNPTTDDGSAQNEQGTSNQ